jgi:hypothetical protein
VLDQGKDRQSFLKKSLGTKNLKEANIRAKPVLAGFDRVLGEAEQLLIARPVRDSLSATEIKRLAEIYYASMLDHDEAVRREGTGTEPGFQSIAAQLNASSGRRTKVSRTRTSSWQRRWPKAWCPRSSAVPPRSQRPRVRPRPPRFAWVRRAHRWRKGAMSHGRCSAYWGVMARWYALCTADVTRVGPADCPLPPASRSVQNAPKRGACLWSSSSQVGSDAGCRR